MTQVSSFKLNSFKCRLYYSRASSAIFVVIFTEWKQFILGFSIYSNIQKLFKIVRPSKAPGASEHLSCLDGMRFISMSLVLICHTYTEVGGHIPSMNFGAMYISVNRVSFIYS